MDSLYAIKKSIKNYASGGNVLIVATLLAFIIANSPIADMYFSWWAQPISLQLGDFNLFSHNGHPMTVMEFINDALMAIFFFSIGLEIKREVLVGELTSIKQALLPIVAAIGGMVIPVLLFMYIGRGSDFLRGSAIPMATDIAFALAVIYLLGDRVPLAAKVFLTTLAIVDDLGSVLVIALFYTSNISLASIAVGIGFLLIMFIANKLGVKNVWFYAILGIGGVWTAFLMSGVHATISAVLSAFMIPADSKIPEAAFISRLKKQLHHFEEAQSNDVITLEKEQVEIITKVKETSKEAVPPLQRLEHGLHPFVAFCIMPIFALSNAGVNFIDMDFSSLFSSNVIIGVSLGLLLGKPIGILLSTWVLTKLKLGDISKTMTWRQLTGIGFLASIGFTMSMFVTALAFTDATNIIQAKVGIFSASIIGGTIGYLLLRSAPHHIKRHQ